MKGYKLTEEKNVPLVIMNLLKAELLLAFQMILNKSLLTIIQMSAFQVGLYVFVASLPNVKVVLSGMSTYAQVEDNLATFKDFKPLDQDEKKLVVKVAKYD